MTSSTANISGSLRRTLAITLLCAVTVLTVLLYFVIRNYAAQIAQQSQDSILQASVTSMLDATKLREGVVEMDIPYVSFSMLNTATDDRVFYTVHQDDKVLSGYDDLQVPQMATDANIVFRSINYKDIPVRQATASRMLVGDGLRTQITASIAQTQDNLSVTLQRISRNAAVFGAGFFLLAALLSAWVVSSTIRPLKKLASSVTRRGPQDLSPVAMPVPTEMGSLVSSLNNFMSRLEKSLTQSEDFIAEAAHRVRTPIATVRSHAEITLQRVEKEENRQALKAMIRATDEASRAAGQLLDHAMVTFRAEQLEFQEFDLVALVEEIVLRLTPIAEMRYVELCLQGDATVMVSGDPILIQNAVRNLIDNALKYSPHESVATITVRSNPAPYVEVQDQGAGYPVQEMKQLTGRFSRGKNSHGTVGSGLGLTIAREVALAHNGELTIANTPQGGACATFSF